ncbi:MULTISPECIES: gephyrin-like molybdotransferase receptor GlpR [Actinoalloteichus]|uniref:Transmembrane protein n=1 Tax=Actinoalloteichus fjordicus TaxID=1612552 RepID=A0AAC9PQ60_9PSEU|nr:MULTISPECIES: gephyrin-like molybdotransferase receptor GlpR [Actinoalloteichus]APU12740.1 hypothetical protein UA74_03290 [Actinoalloteichus fjordicus]APU18710.1 hypothetical protein UA75_03380 [Actinoalloteichus sp. GBA129-24]
MPSSLIFAALALAWLVVLVPMIARRRQEVVRTADSALEARVLRRGKNASAAGRQEAAGRQDASTGGRQDGLAASRRGASGRSQVVDDPEEDPDMADPDAHSGREFDGERDDEFGDEFDDYDDESGDDEDWRALHGDDVRAGRRYRPGRGGFDPEAAARLARAKYAFRQRIVLLLLLAAITTAVLAGFLSAWIWWAHAAVDLTFIGYLSYLRRQVRIEEEVRRRRTARVAEAQRREHLLHGQVRSVGDVGPVGEDGLPTRSGGMIAQGASELSRRPSLEGTYALELDDDDPAFDDLDSPLPTTFRRAVGE